MRNIYNDHFRFSGNREKVIQRDGEKCVKCGMTRQEHKIKYGRDIAVDHIDGKGCSTPKENKNNNLDNLQTLCLSCHTYKEITLRISIRKAMGIPPRMCSIEGCSGIYEARGLCDKHYWRWRMHGDANKVTFEQPRVLRNGKLQCSKCGTRKPINGFYSDKRKAYGVGSVCKECGRVERLRHYHKKRERELIITNQPEESGKQ